MIVLVASLKKRVLDEGSWAGSQSPSGSKWIGSKRLAGLLAAPRPLMGAWLMYSNEVAKHPVAQLGLKPCALRRHNGAGVGDRYQVFDAGREHGKGTGKLAAVDQFLQLRRTPDAAHELDSLAGPRIIDGKDWSQHVSLQQGRVKLIGRSFARR